MTKNTVPLWSCDAIGTMKLQMVGLVLTLLLALAVSDEKITVLRNTIDPAETATENGGATLKNISVHNDDPILNRTESFTFCLRFYLEVLGTISEQRRGNVIQIGNPRFIRLWAVYPNREVQNITIIRVKESKKTCLFILQQSLLWRYWLYPKASRSGLQTICSSQMEPFLLVF